MAAVKRFLISRLSALGDVVCSLPAAGALRSAFPESEIVWVVDSRFAGVVECCSAVSEVIRAKPGFKPKSWPKIDGPFDAAFDLQGLLKSAVVLRSQKCPRFGYHWQREGASLFSQPVTPDPSSHHIVDQYVDVVRAFGVEAGAAEFNLNPITDDLPELPPKFVAINPGAAWVTKRWPPQYTAEVIDWLSAQGIQSVLLGGPSPSDRQSADDVLGYVKSTPTNLVGATSVKQLIGVISKAKAHLGSDTGSTHIAAALGVPAVALYSLTNPVRSCPYGQIENCVRNAEGLWLIQPSEVIPVLERVLSQ